VRGTFEGVSAPRECGQPSLLPAGGIIWSFSLCQECNDVETGYISISSAADRISYFRRAGFRSQNGKCIGGIA
ncbi:MAG: hypothetical protein ACI4AI_03125, partial [Paludibacteraceae bacterium]